MKETNKNQEEINQISEKLQEYKSLLDFSDDYFRKDYKGNLKFIQTTIKKMIKTDSVDRIISFIDHCIEIHKINYLRIV